MGIFLLVIPSYRALNLKTWGSDTEPKALVVLMVLELFEDANDGVKRGRKMVKRTSRIRYVVHRMNDENEPGVVRRKFKRY